VQYVSAGVVEKLIKLELILLSYLRKSLEPDPDNSGEGSRNNKEFWYPTRTLFYSREFINPNFLL